MTRQKKIASSSRYWVGRQWGYGDGQRDGYHYGKALAIKQQLEREHVRLVWNKRVLFVTTGKGYPYSPLDQAVADALRAITLHCEAVSPKAALQPILDRMKPDLVIVLEGMEFPLEALNQIRERGIRTAIWLTDDPYYTDITGKLAPYYEHVFTLELSCLDFYRQMGCRQVQYLPLGVNPSAFFPRPVTGARRLDASFIGTGYWNRIAFFNRIFPSLLPRKVLISGWWWDRLKRYRRYRGRIQLGKWMGPEETSEYYCASQIVINLHRAHDDESYNSNSRKIPALSVNPRTFEIAACGAFQLSDERADLMNLFTPGEEMITYSSPEDFLAKLHYYLSHPEERSGIAIRAMQRTLREHTYEARLQKLLSAVFEGEHPG